MQDMLNRMSDKETGPAAYHEAGHSVVAWMSGFNVRWARIVREGPLAGGVLYQPTVVRAAIDPLDCVGVDTRILFVKCAGAAAESIYAGNLSYPLDVADHDIESAYALLRDRGIRSRTALADIVAGYLDTTERILLQREVWRAVALLASELVARQTLGGAAITRMLQQRFQE